MGLASLGSTLLAAETFEPISVETLPAGATVIVDGQVGGITPMVLTLSRRLVHSIRIELDGYHPQAAELRPEVDWSDISRNLLGGPLFGILGGAAELATGEARHLTPSAIEMTLVRMGEVEREFLPAVARSVAGK